MQERHALSLSLSLSLTVLAQDAINSAALAQIACVAPLPFAAGRGGGGRRTLSSASAKVPITFRFSRRGRQGPGQMNSGQAVKAAKAAKSWESG
ncbi:predicted protein [Plenodomus lingam JN3]|uniref:Predicted protein n=1 Tax=Leptosphaeria maculans (strain JN3 / isolate v23.1.3 / race Av1-4-5-6-7-8) TaxID=985895 RepID=E4ZW81_LEPMJ|nr:predicted protein [Plenodomus lingam JN3]CBX95857.1 predicted protein [Plenodomus lingam JN3]